MWDHEFQESCQISLINQQIPLHDEVYCVDLLCNVSGARHHLNSECNVMFITEYIRISFEQKPSKPRKGRQGAEQE